jgi:plasmid stability protein
MATLVIHDLPDALHRELESLAEANGRPLEAEIVALLEQSVRSAEMALRSIEEFRALRQRHPLPALTADEIERAITEGRA